MWVSSRGSGGDAERVRAPVPELAFQAVHRVAMPLVGGEVEELVRVVLEVVELVEIAGRVGGGGNEFAMACDMRFGAIGRTIINQMEVPLGILPGGGGTQRLPRLVGRGRALEIILGGIDVDAVTAERWGLLNRALAPDELTPYVDGLARRIASFPPEAVALAKESIGNVDTMSMVDGLAEEAHLFERTLRIPGTAERMRSFLERGGQTRETELNIADASGPSV